MALSAAVVLASALIYTSFSASSEARTPSQLAAVATPGKTYQLTGKVVAGYKRVGDTTYFKVRDRTGHPGQVLEARQHDLGGHHRRDGPCQPVRTEFLLRRRPAGDPAPA